MQFLLRTQNNRTLNIHTRKWEPYHTRRDLSYLVPLFLFAAVIALALLGRARRVQTIRFSVISDAASALWSPSIIEFSANRELINKKNVCTATVIHCQLVCHVITLRVSAHRGYVHNKRARFQRRKRTVYHVFSIKENHRFFAIILYWLAQPSNPLQLRVYHWKWVLIWFKHSFLHSEITFVTF